jgi:hypothetical protein
LRQTPTSIPNGTTRPSFVVGSLLNTNRMVDAVSSRELELHWFRRLGDEKIPRFIHWLRSNSSSSFFTFMPLRLFW